jgi:1-acyl-sn-glycerol-3-phosphate acyltransferase
MSGGVIYLGGGTPVQKECGFDDTPEEMFKYLMASCGPCRNEAKIRAYSQDSVGQYQWLVEHGVPFKAVFYPHYSGEPPHLPQTGRAMLVGNHSGGYAIDAGMVIAACFFEIDPPRLAHGMADRFLNRLPFASRMASRSGQLTGSAEQARRLLADDRLLLVFPEGAQGTAKLFRDRYTLRPFTTGFARLALEMQAPVIPFAFFGGGEAVPTVANLVRLGKLLGLPYLPVTPYLLPLPLPVRAQIRFGAPLRLEGTGSERREVLELQVQRVRDAVDGLLQSRLHSDRDPGGGSAP